MKILVVDDSKLARLSLIKAAKKVEPSGEFIEASDGETAVELFEKERPSVVFLDLTMPVMSGYEALNRIMAIDPGAQVIVVSADIQPEAKKRVLNSGAKNMYPKPIDDDKMLNIFQHDLVI